MARARKHPLPSIAELHAIYDYNPTTGQFVHKARAGRTGAERFFNRKWAGEVAGSVQNIGYAFLRVGPRYYLGHRLAWAMFHGEWPVGEIDHINGRKLDNRIENLRIVTRAENCRNRPGRALSGFKGVRRDGARWRASLMVGGKFQSLGSYSTPEEAHEAYKIAAREHHGDYANFDVLNIGTIEATVLFGMAA